MVKFLSRRGFPAYLSGSTMLLLVGLATACRREEISVYEVPKEVKATSLPAGWEELPADQMRVANYAVRGKDGGKVQVTVIALPGSAGTEADNVNRWRGQVGLEPQTEAEIKGEATSITVAGTPARLFELSGMTPETKARTRMLAAWQDHGDSRWFFKMMGDDNAVREQRDAFLEFCRNYHYPDAQTETSGSPKTDEPAPAPSSASNEQNWKAPPEWKAQQPGPMQDAKFLAADGRAVITISIFEGSTGGVLANVNRWRAQLQLSPVTEADLSSLVTSLDSAGEGAKLVDMNGPKQRMVAAIVARGSKTSFFKLMGDASSVGAEKERFITFVKSAKS